VACPPDRPNFQGLKINMSIYQRLAGHSEF
jgi:hypothetical protein